MPEQNLPSWGVALHPASVTVSVLEGELRHLEVPVIGRIEEDRLLLDMRTVADNEVAIVAGSLQQVFAGEANRLSI